MTTRQSAERIRLDPRSTINEKLLAMWALDRLEGRRTPHRATQRAADMLRREGVSEDVRVVSAAILVQEPAVGIAEDIRDAIRRAAARAIDGKRT